MVCQDLTVCKANALTTVLVSLALWVHLYFCQKDGLITKCHHFYQKPERPMTGACTAESISAGGKMERNSQQLLVEL